MSDRELPATREKAEARVAELERQLDELDSYNGHLAWMDKHYPLDVPYFAESEDVGCQVMRLSRKVMELERMLRLSIIDMVETQYPQLAHSQDEDDMVEIQALIDHELADLKARAQEPSE